MVVAPSFGDIFFSNAVQIGLVPVMLDASEVKDLMARLGHGGELTVDLEAQTISGAAGEVVPFEMDQFVRHALLEGLGAITRTLQHEAEIAAFEARLQSVLRTTSL